MGTEYVVLDQKNKRLFLLGKWPYFPALSEPKIFGLDRATKHELVETLLASWPWPGADVYMAQLADKLSRFCEEADWQVEMVRDDQDLPEWPVICSRYDGTRLDADPLGGVGWDRPIEPKETP